MDECTADEWQQKRESMGARDRRKTARPLWSQFCVRSPDTSSYSGGTNEGTNEGETRLGL